MMAPMSPLLALLATVVPLSLLAAASPVIFLNSATFVLRGQRSSAWGYLTGNALVLLPIGIAAAGLLGAATATQLDRDIASRTVDAVLGLVLLGYGAWLVRRAEHPAPTGGGSRRGSVPFGLLAMATNFTTLPLYISAAQHVGNARPPLWAATLLIAGITVVTVTPAWLPLALTQVAPTLLNRFTRTPPESQTPRRWTVGTLIPIAACLLGGAILLIHAAGFVGHQL